MNKVNPYIGLDEANKALTLLESVEQMLRKYGQNLSPKQRQAILKYRRGADKVVPQITGLARKNGLQVEGVPLDDIEASLAAARRVEPIKVAAQVAFTAISDMVLRAESVTWSGATLYYSLLDRMANNNPALRVALKPVKKFFTQRSPSAKKNLTATRATRQAANADKQAKKAAQKVESMNARRSSTKTATNGVSATNGVAANGVNATNGAAANGVHTTP